MSVGRVRLSLEHAYRVRLPERGKVALVFAGDVLVVAHLSREGRGGDGQVHACSRGGMLSVGFTRRHKTVSEKKFEPLLDSENGRETVQAVRGWRRLDLDSTNTRGAEVLRRTNYETSPPS